MTRLSHTIIHTHTHSQVRDLLFTLRISDKSITISTIDGLNRRLPDQSNFAITKPLSLGYNRLISTYVRGSVSTIRIISPCGVTIEVP